MLLPCPHCQNSIDFTGQQAGAIVACPICGGHVQVPGTPSFAEAYQPPRETASAKRKAKRKSSLYPYIALTWISGVILYFVWTAFSLRQQTFVVGDRLADGTTKLFALILACSIVWTLWSIVCLFAVILVWAVKSRRE